MIEIHSFWSQVRITIFGVEIHAQNSWILSSKNDSNHYFWVDSTIILEWIQLQTKVISNTTPKRVDFHSSALREHELLFTTLILKSHNFNSGEYRRLRARRALMLFNYILLRNNRTLSSQTLYSDSALLVLNGTLLNGVYALLLISNFLTIFLNFFNHFQNFITRLYISHNLSLYWKKRKIKIYLLFSNEQIMEKWIYIKYHLHYCHSDTM